MIGFALHLYAPCYLGTDALDGPAAKVLVQVACSRLQLNTRKFAIHSQDSILYRSGLGYKHRQHTARREARKMNVLQHLARGGTGKGHGSEEHTSELQS